MSTHRAKGKLLVQLAVVISFFIFTIEGILLVTSYQARKAQYAGINADLHDIIMEQTGIDFPTPLDEAYVDKQLDQFVVNIILLTLLICFVVVTGTVSVCYFLVIKPIWLLRKVNQESSHKKAVYYPADKIPNNELGQLIESRNKILRELKGYQDDITQKLDEAKVQLMHTAKLSLLGEMTSSIAHDVRNPLSVIEGHTKRLKSQLDESNMDPNSLKNSVEKIRFGTKRIHRLIEQMNRFSAKKVEFSQAVSMREVIENSLVLLEKKISNNRVRVTTNIPDNITFWGDSGSMEQVLSNLISNAADAMEESQKRELSISVSQENESVLVRVGDSGKGIASDHLDKIFESFFTTKDIGKGTGLGLSICKQIVQDHKGSISVDSTPGVGTEFTIQLCRSMSVDQPLAA